MNNEVLLPEEKEAVFFNKRSLNNEILNNEDQNSNVSLNWWGVSLFLSGCLGICVASGYHLVTGDYCFLLGIGSIFALFKGSFMIVNGFSEY